MNFSRTYADTIYVRAFEDRMDLLRAVIVGPSGTPYKDGLFFFDLQLPLSYPAAPPQVYYHSFGLRLNPYLYASGTVCLSLLNTFGGDGTKVWSPVTSALLQVLVSIQGLVLSHTTMRLATKTWLARRRAAAMRCLTTRRHICSPYGPCSTCYVASRRDLRSSSRTISVSGEDSCLGHARHTFKDASSERSLVMPATPRRIMSGRARQG